MFIVAEIILMWWHVK